MTNVQSIGERKQEIAKTKLEREKERLRAKEKDLKMKEQKKRFKELSEIGRLALQADIDQLDRDLLLGAFLEISQRSNDATAIKNWKEGAENFLKKRDKDKLTPLSISFVADPSKEVKEQLKGLKFRWNRFRQEFTGYGDKSDLEELLSEHQIKIEVL